MSKPSKVKRRAAESVPAATRSLVDIAVGALDAAVAALRDGNGGTAGYMGAVQDLIDAVRTDERNRSGAQ